MSWKCRDILAYFGDRPAGRLYAVSTSDMFLTALSYLPISSIHKSQATVAKLETRLQIYV